MVAGCIVPSCRNSRRLREKLVSTNAYSPEIDDVSFFKFPTANSELLEKWKRIVPRPDWEPRPHDRLCSEHFMKSCFIMKKIVSRKKVPGRPSKKLAGADNSTTDFKPQKSYKRSCLTLRPGSIPTKTNNYIHVPQKLTKAKRRLKAFQEKIASEEQAGPRERIRPPDKKIPLQDLNQYLICVVCQGYYVNPVTITECLHTFCRSCLVRHFYTNLRCPDCQVEVHPTEPLTNVRVDTLKQDILARLLPHVETDEEKREIAFYEERGLPRPIRQEQHTPAPVRKPAAAAEPVSETTDADVGGEEDKTSLFYPRERLVSLVLEYAGCVGLHIRVQPLAKKFVRTAACVTIAQLKKYIKLKLRSRMEVEIDLLCDNAFLDDDWDLEFVADFFYEDEPDGIIQLHYVITRHGLRVAVPDLFQTPPTSPVPTGDVTIRHDDVTNDHDDDTLDHDDVMIEDSSDDEVQMRIRNQVSPIDFDLDISMDYNSNSVDGSRPASPGDASDIPILLSASNSSSASLSQNLLAFANGLNGNRSSDSNLLGVSGDNSPRVGSSRNSPIEFGESFSRSESPIVDLPMPELVEERAPVDLLTMIDEDSGTG